MSKVFFFEMDVSNNMAHSIITLQYMIDSDMYWIIDSKFV